MIIKENLNGLGFIFPGQGSQSIDMLADCWAHPTVIRTFEEANAALGYSLSTIIQTGDAETLGQTEITQPALLAVSIALWRMWREETDLRPAVVAGHSLGEYSALVAAEAIDFGEAIQVVAKRGLYMQEAAPVGIGAMAAVIGMADDEVVAACKEISAEGEVAAVNFNSPGQVVIAGKKALVDSASILIKARGAKRVMLLPVSVPSHCILMKPASDRLAQLLLSISIKTPAIDVIHNVDVNSHKDAESIRRVLTTQLYQPVRWTEIIQAFTKMGINTVIECGSGKVLTGLARRIDKTLSLANIFDQASLHNVIKEYH